MLSDGSILLSMWLGTYLLHSTLLLGGVWLLIKLHASLADELKELLWRSALIGGVITATIQVSTSIQPVVGQFNLTWAQNSSQVDVVSAESVTKHPTNEHGTGAQHHVHDLLLPELSDHDAVIGLPMESMGSGITPIKEDAMFTADSPAQAGLEKSWDAQLNDHSEQDSQETAAQNSESILLSGFNLLQWSRSILIYVPVSVACLAFGLLLVSLIRRSRLHRRISQRMNVTDSLLLNVLENLRSNAGMKRNLRLTTSAKLTTPMALGIFRPEICLPQWIVTELKPSEQKTILAHELAHHVRRDPLWLLFYQCLEIGFLFQPLNRIARRRLQDISELRCDDWAARHTDGGITLARCLVNVATWLTRSTPPPAFEHIAAMARHPSTLQQRVRRLLDVSSKPRRLHLRKKYSFTAMTACVLIAPLLLPGVQAADSVSHEVVDKPSIVNADQTGLSGDIITEQLRGLDSDLASLEGDVRSLRGKITESSVDDESVEFSYHLEEKLVRIRENRNWLSEILAHWDELRYEPAGNDESPPILPDVHDPNETIDY